MKTNSLYTILSLLVALSLMLAASAPQQATKAPTQAPAAATDEPVATAEPTEEPAAPATTRHGGWLDEIVVSVVDGDSAISQIQAGANDLGVFHSS
jgi:hypothetical protein